MEDEFESICPIVTRRGILYSLSKVRKIVIDSILKLRPILSAIGTPAYKLVKFLVSILSPLTGNDYTVKDSFSFAKEVVNFDHNLFMGSLDVESLFTKIPIDETIKNAFDYVFSNNIYQEILSKIEMYYLLKLATSEPSFIYDYILYKQIDGVSMGSLLGHTLANAFYVIMKNFGLIIVHQSLNMLYTEDMLTTYLFCLTPKIIYYYSLDI